MSRFRIIALTGLLLSVKSITSKSNQLPLLAKSFSSSTAMEQSILDAIGKISLSPIEKGALKDTTKIDAGNKTFMKTPLQDFNTKQLLSDCILPLHYTKALSGKQDLFSFMSSEDQGVLYVVKKH